MPRGCSCHPRPRTASVRRERRRPERTVTGSQRPYDFIDDTPLVEFHGMTVRERRAALISIGHPAFPLELTDTLRSLERFV